MVEKDLDIKLIALDLDGTLLNSNKEISAKNFTALNKAFERNIYIVLATGRPLIGLPNKLMNSKIKYAICSNGASIIDVITKKPIYCCTLDKEKVINIVEKLNKIDPIIDIFTDGKIITEKRNIKRMDKFLIPSNMKEYIYNTRITTDNIIKYLDKKVKHVEKVNLFFKDINQRKLVVDELSRVEGVAISSSLNNNIELNDRKASKGEALLWLSKYLKISKEQIMACGDSDNDLSMLKVAKLGIAMGNAIDEVKIFAHYITSSNDEDGVAKAIEKFID